MPPLKRHRIVTDVTRLCQMASLVPPNIIAAFSPPAAGKGVAICGTDRVSKDEAIIFTANCAAMGQQSC